MLCSRDDASLEAFEERERQAQEKAEAQAASLDRAFDGVSKVLKPLSLTRPRLPCKPMRHFLLGLLRVATLSSTNCSTKLPGSREGTKAPAEQVPRQGKI